MLHCVVENKTCDSRFWSDIHSQRLLLGASLDKIELISSMDTIIVMTLYRLNKWKLLTWPLNCTHTHIYIYTYTMWYCFDFGMCHDGMLKFLLILLQRNFCYLMKNRSHYFHFVPSVVERKNWFDANKLKWWKLIFKLFLCIPREGSVDRLVLVDILEFLVKLKE